MIPLYEAAINLSVALGLGAMIGFERQWRRRNVSLRTNALVSLGAASFMIFSTLMPHDASPSRVAAQVVSGIGFIGAGLIFRDGSDVRGLNTATTTWCSAAVGLLAGMGALSYAALVTIMVMSIHFVLRPLANHLSVGRLPNSKLQIHYVVKIVCQSERGEYLRGALLRSFAPKGLKLSRLDSRDIENSDQMEISASITATKESHESLEKIVGRISADTSVTAASWYIETAQDVEPV